jgi:hypothetical protein
VLPSPLDQPLVGVTINGRESQAFTKTEAVVDQFPATVELHYGGAPEPDGQRAQNKTARDSDDDGQAKPKDQHS